MVEVVGIAVEKGKKYIRFLILADPFVPARERERYYVGARFGNQDFVEKGKWKRKEETKKKKEKRIKEKTKKERKSESK